MQQQIPLNLQLRDDATFANFYVGGNAALLSHLLASLHNKQERFFYLWGSPGVGCTHLLHACCHEADTLETSAMYLSLENFQEYTPEILEGFEHSDVLCLDNVQCIAANKHWEEALFHLYNRIRDAKGLLIITANCAPRQLPLQLADLSSRLAWGAAYQVMPLSDPQKIEAFIMRAENRGLHLSEEVGHFLLSRSSRDMNTLAKILDKLDHASLAEQRRLTIPFVKSVLEI